MTEYMSYFKFLTDTKSIINDFKIDMKCEAFSGEAFDKAYNAFLRKLVQRCKEYMESSFRGQSKFIANYVSDIRGTTNYTQLDRINKLMDITEDYSKRAL
ncbi:hypothetical protein J6A31_06015 [bacterium]|nr:hypothetical protein [bacterium]